jgi:hypothetical protein
MLPDLVIDALPGRVEDNRQFINREICAALILSQVTIEIFSETSPPCYRVLLFGGIACHFLALSRPFVEVFADPFVYTHYNILISGASVYNP